MISLLRHNVSLLASLVGVVAGLAVFAYAAVQFAGALYFYSVMSASSLLVASGFKANAALMIVGQHAVVAALGGALVFFAGRSFIRTWRAGPPTDESAAGGSPVARLVGILLYGAGALYGSYGLIFGMGPLLDDYNLALQGDKTTARIVRVEPAPDIHWDVQRVHYTFKTQRGETVEGVANKFSYPATLAAEQGWVEVTYDPQDPRRNEADFSFSIQSALAFLGGQMVLVFLGIWGFAKNASASNNPPPPAGMALPPPPAPMQQRIPRTTFGRRGA